MVAAIKSDNQTLPMDIQNTRVMFMQDKILLSGDVTVSGFKTNVAIKAGAQVQNNQFKFTIDQVNLGKLPLPEALVNKVKQSLVPDNEMTVDLTQMNIPMLLTDLKLENGQIVLTGVTR